MYGPIALSAIKVDGIKPGKIVGGVTRSDVE